MVMMRIVLMELMMLLVLGIKLVILHTASNQVLGVVDALAVVPLPQSLFIQEARV
jgi:hypothetical protein